MKLLFSPALAVFSIFCGLAVIDTTIESKQSQHVPVAPAKHPKIQAAILLDVSGSMNGLIEQAKAQL